MRGCDATEHSSRAQSTCLRRQLTWERARVQARVALSACPRRYPALRMADDRLPRLELEAWGGFLRTHAMLYLELERRLLRSHGLTISAYDVLLRLAWAGRDGLRMSDLAKQVLKTSGGLTRLADRLERDGLIARTRSTDDLRGYEARITTAGRRLLRRANRQHLQDVRELFLSHLGERQLSALADAWRAIAVADFDGRDIPTATR
jgi:DNA-binding MarR family transcriptional regulator